VVEDLDPEVDGKKVWMLARKNKQSLSRNLHFLASKLAETPRNDRERVMLEAADKIIKVLRSKIEGRSMVLGFEDVTDGIVIKFDPIWSSNKRFQSQIKSSTEKFARRIHRRPEVKTGLGQVQIVFSDRDQTKIDRAVDSVRSIFPNITITEVVGPSLVTPHSFQIRIEEDHKNNPGSFMSALRPGPRSPIGALVEKYKNNSTFGEVIKDFDISKGRGSFALEFQDYELLELLEREAIEEAKSLGEILMNDFELDIRPGNHPDQFIFSGVLTELDVGPNEVRLTTSDRISSYFVYKGDLNGFLNSSTRLKKLEALWPKLHEEGQGDTMSLFEDPERDEFANLGSPLDKMMKSLGYSVEDEYDEDNDLVSITYSQGDIRIIMDLYEVSAESSTMALGGTLPGSTSGTAMILKEIHNLLKLG